MKSMRYILVSLVLFGVLMVASFSLVLGGEPDTPLCRPFSRIAGGTSMIGTFSWSAVSGADEYKLNIYGGDGLIVKSIWVKAPTTSIDLNMGDYATGPSFQWEVEALQNGTRLCNTGRSPMSPKPGDPNTPQPRFVPPTETPFPTPTIGKPL